MRQSSDAQVRRNTGSADIQREGANWGREAGWTEDLTKIRDDLGSSALEPGSREELDQLIEDIWAWRIGAVYVIEISRIARNEEDWGKFAHAARRRGVLLVVRGHVYDFKDPNQACFAGVMGAFAVRDGRVWAELSQEAKRKKALKGQAPTARPVGYVRLPGGDWDFYPNEQVREVIRLVFQKIFEIGSGRGLLRYLRQNGIQLPRRARGEGIRWADATWNMLSLILRNPAYAGIYIYGRTIRDYAREPFKNGQRRSLPCPADQWIVIQNHHPAYVEPHRSTEIQELLRRNRRVLQGPPGRGDALLQGLLVCTLHGCKLETRYPYREHLPDGSVKRTGAYQCVPTSGAGESKVCCTIRSSRLDARIEAELFKELRPPSLEDMREVASEAVRQNEALVRPREDERRRRKRRAAELEEEFLRTPSSQRHVRERLRELWQKALREGAELEELHRLQPLAPPPVLDEPTIMELQHRLRELPSFWRQLAPQQRKLIVRVVIKAVYVTPGADRWKVKIEWIDGPPTEFEVLRREGIEAVVQQDYAKGWEPAKIAEHLNELGAVRQTSLHAGTAYSSKPVRRMTHRLGLQQSYNAEAYAYIRKRAGEGVRHCVIADELNDAGLRHELGKWSRSRVNYAVQQLRRGRIKDVEPLPSVVRLTDEIHAFPEDLSAKEIMARLRERGVLNREGRPPKITTIRHILWRLGRRGERSKAREHWIALLKPMAATTTIREITRRVNELGFLNLYGKPWTEGGIARKLVSLSLRTPDSGVERDEAIRRLWAETHDLADVTRRANEEDILTRRGYPWRTCHMARKLASLGLCSPKKRGPYRKRRLVGGVGSSAQMPRRSARSRDSRTTRSL